jgi:hypothetical protein
MRGCDCAVRPKYHVAVSQQEKSVRYGNWLSCHERPIHDVQVSAHSSLHVGLLIPKQAGLAGVRRKVQSVWLLD